MRVRARLQTRQERGEFSQEQQAGTEGKDMELGDVEEHKVESQGGLSDIPDVIPGDSHDDDNACGAHAKSPDYEERVFHLQEQEERGRGEHKRPGRVDTGKGGRGDTEARECWSLLTTFSS